MPANGPPDDTLSTFSEARRGCDEPTVVARPHLYLVIEGDRPRAGSARCALDGVDEVVLRRAAERSIERGVADGRNVLSIGAPDRQMSGVHASIVHDDGELVVVDHGSTNGTWVNGERVERRALSDADVIEVGRTFFRFRAAVPTPDGTPDDVTAESLAETPAGLRTLEPRLAASFAAVARVARSGVPMVVNGATGTGKELLARAVHGLSGRPGGFVAVNCGALPEQLVESALFGHVRGAFSGALRDEPGYLRAAHGGTLFLDEIADLARPSQAALLRALQENEVTPVGATRPVAVDLRVLCATHADLDGLAVSGDFRLDLLARLVGMRVLLPPLCQRMDDLGSLVAEILAARGGEAAWAFEPEALRAMLRYDWPTNVRELAQCLGLAAALTEDGTINLAHLPEAVRGPRGRTARAVSGRPPGAAAERAVSERPQADMSERPHADRSEQSQEGASERPPGAALRRAEESPEDAALRAVLVAAFAEHGGNVSAVARATGKARMQIQRWMKRFDIDPAAFKPR